MGKSPQKRKSYCLKTDALKETKFSKNSWKIMKKLDKINGHDPITFTNILSFFFNFLQN